jgi:uncharacterized protein involved in exopolysaccharide biosynthesis/Mrp family chromosome partitioning ATPase
MTFRADDFDFASAAREAPTHAARLPRRQEAERLDLRGLLRVLRRRALEIVLTVAICVGLIILFLALTTPLYTATTQVLIDPRDRRVLQTEVTPTAFGNDAALVESQVRIITSDAVLRRVVISERLADDPEFGRPDPNTPGARIRGAIGIRDEADDPQLRALKTLERRISVRRAERTYIMEVRATSRDAAKAARLADAVAQAYLVDQAEANQVTTRRTTGALTSRLDELRENLRQAENRAQEFRTRNAIVGAQGQTVTEQQLVELNQRLVLARARVAEIQARVDQVNRFVAQNGGADSGALSDALNSNVILALRTQFSEISRREAELLNQLGPRHPAVVDIRAQLANVRRLINEELRRIADSSRNELAVARANEQSLARDLDRLQQRTLDTNQAQIRLRELEREVEAARQVFEAFLNRSIQTSEQERIETTSARIIAPAVIPSEAGFPPRNLMLVLGLLGGLGLGVTMALLREHLDDTFRSAAQLRRIAGLDLLAAVPLVGRGARGLFRSSAAGLPFDVIDRPSGPFGSAIRTLRNELRDGPGRAAERSALIVSAVEGEGRTSVALNLALAAAASGERVLIVDTDLAQRGLSRRVAPNARLGFLEVMDGEARLLDAVVRDPRSGLCALPLVVPRGGLAERPSRAQFALLLDAARPHFDYVIFDGGPLTVDFGARVIGEVADQIVMVVRAGVTRRGEVVEALQLLRAPEQKLRGAVLNMADAKASTRYELG